MVDKLMHGATTTRSFTKTILCRARTQTEGNSSEVATSNSGITQREPCLLVRSWVRQFRFRRISCSHRANVYFYVFRFHFYSAQLYNVEKIWSALALHSWESLSQWNRENTKKGHGYGYIAKAGSTRSRMENKNRH